MIRKLKFLLTVSFSVAALSLAACENYKPIDANKSFEDKEEANVDFSKRKSLFGEGGIQLFGRNERSEEGGSLGVNSFLWRASLDTIYFMPVNSADPFGGVIITDWHASAEAPTERFKLNVYILGRTLRADGVRVAVFRQIKSGTGWQDADVSSDTQIKIEDAILTRARQLRNAALAQ
jgi:hypothetical protein